MIKIVASHNELEKRQKSGNEADPEKLESERFKILSKWFNNSSQLKRIDEIIDGSQVYQKSLARLREPIRRFEEIISKFFIEGNKRIKVENAGEISVLLGNDRKASVFELSSGEKQIIIMIAHLIFSEDSSSGGIFIIDEPELSLHIAWQEIFVDSIQEASPGTQFILATHSPSIIAKTNREKFCQDISKSN
jgi:predicted ATP-binding protein involved in virulence